MTIGLIGGLKKRIPRLNLKNQIISETTHLMIGWLHMKCPSMWTIQKSLEENCKRTSKMPF